MNWYLTAFRKYAVFSGRSRRREYWFWVLFNIIVVAALASLDVMLSSALLGSPLTLLSAVYGLASLIPGLAVSVRRLHDTGHSAWALFLGLIPLVGAIILLVWDLTDSQPGDNRYGPNPKQPAAVAAPDAPWRQPI